MDDMDHYTHSPDVLERDTVDNGFSAGWGTHFQPKEDFWVDAHCHLEATDEHEIEQGLGLLRSVASMMNIRFVSLILPMGLRGEDPLEKSTMIGLVEKIHRDSFFKPILYLPYDNPDLDLLAEFLAHGGCGVKLHNGPLITGGADYRVWENESWDAIFRKLSEFELPVLWHVTQRVSSSPYTGGGSATYWKDGWERGIKYTNQDLLNIFLKTVKSYPSIPFIAAHQLHMGWERLIPILEENLNLSIDTSVGCVVNEFDSLYPRDKDFIRDWFIRLQDRILFGTDTIVDKNISEIDMRENYANHIRFIKQLQLPDGPLQNISHQNSVRKF